MYIKGNSITRKHGKQNQRNKNRINRGFPGLKDLIEGLENVKYEKEDALPPKFPLLGTPMFSDVRSCSPLIMPASVAQRQSVGIGIERSGFETRLCHPVFPLGMEI